jgi:fermentation-respiration switch protein FrsA (DUF1100 family)
MPTSPTPDQIVPVGPEPPRPRWLRILGLIVPIPRGKGIRGKTVWVIRRILLWYVILVVMIATFQRYLIYQPTRVVAINPETSGLAASRVESVTVRTNDGLDLRGWLVRALPSTTFSQSNGSSHHPVIIYFPGNAGHRGYRAMDLDLLSRVGADVYLFDYRGYGDSPGSPTEESLAADARAIWNDLTQKQGVSPNRIVILGESLGGGVATRLASELCAEGIEPAGLVLRCTFSSLTDVARYHYPWLPVRWLLIDRFPSVDRIPNVTCPILKVHGTADDVVPLRYGKLLFDAAPPQSARGIPKTFVQIQGAGHNDILFVAREEFRAAVNNFLHHLRPAH